MEEQPDRFLFESGPAAGGVLNTTALPTRIPVDHHHESPAFEKELFPDITWKDIYDLDANLAAEVFRLAQSYGYEQGMTLEKARI